MLYARLTGGQEYTYIDVYEGGKFMSEVELVGNGASDDVLTEAPVVKVGVRRKCTICARILFRTVDLVTIVAGVMYAENLIYLQTVYENHYN